MNKVRKECTLYQDNIEYVQSIKEKYTLSSFSSALDKIVEEHKSYNDVYIENVANTIVNKIEDKYKNLFTRMRLGINGADKNSQVLLEILNSIIINENMKRSYDIDIYEAEIVKDCKENVTNRIARYKQIKDNKSK